ncbi:muconolactone Delta-isomerase family protein [Pseudonocardia broussonetiae]|uniref:Translational initiation factor n=1 Tax=Pseudonocardia broussonetiae TaxID=2736640 RepID=A0A6M6JHM4_9PSEU|nr:muconolactone Delta-isomerase family protein [Pseudonocardia broussonetiae]QJY46397.1 translational initiation factor [Pseudonocardia broussonetiae]
MLFFFSVRVEHSGVTFDELWDEWEKEVDAAQGAVSAGKIKEIYKVSGQRRVVGILDVESHEELDRIVMAGLPMTHMLEFEEIVPVRDYAGFADDVRKRWQQ